MIMSKISIKIISVISLLFLITCTSNINASEKKLPSISVGKEIVDLTYKTKGFNTYTYDGKGVISCSSSDTSYVTCLVDPDKKRVVLTPIKATNKDVVITLKAVDKTQLVKNNANIKYEGEEEVVLEELMNPVVEVQKIPVPDTGSNKTVVGLVIGIMLIAGSGYAIYRKYNMKVGQ